VAIATLCVLCGSEPQLNRAGVLYFCTEKRGLESRLLSLNTGEGVRRYLINKTRS
jgi:hypothetical protein